MDKNGKEIDGQNLGSPPTPRPYEIPSQSDFQGQAQGQD